MTTTTHGPSVIHKFLIPLDGTTVLPVCASAQVLHVAKQSPAGGPLSIWFVIPIDHKGRTAFAGDGRAFEVYGTGHDVPGGRMHVGSVFDGPFVWHAFERRLHV